MRANDAAGAIQLYQQAIQAAEAAFKEWADVTAEDRGNALMNACELIKKNSSEIVQLLTQEQGKTLFESGLEIHHLVHGLEFYAGLASKVRGSHVPLPQKGAYGMVVRQPIGVCGGIVPWNFPLTLMGTKLGPALAAGNTIIIKPASTTPLATIRLAELMAEGGLPDAGGWIALVVQPAVMAGVLLAVWGGELTAAGYDAVLGPERGARRAMPWRFSTARSRRCRAPAGRRTGTAPRPPA